MRAATGRGLTLIEAKDFDAPIGRGVTGTVDGKRLLLGAPRLMAEEGVEISALAIDAEHLRSEGALLRERHRQCVTASVFPAVSSHVGSASIIRCSRLREPRSFNARRPHSRQCAEHSKSLPTDAMATTNRLNCPIIEIFAETT